MAEVAARRFASTSALLMAARIAGAGAGFAAQILLARMMPADQLGLFFLATSVAAVLGAVASGGYPSVMGRFVARYQAWGRPELLAEFLRHVRSDAWRTGCAMALALAAVAALAPLHPDLRIALAGGAASLPVIALARLNGAFAGATRRFALSYLPELFWRPILFALAVAVAAVLGIGVSGAGASVLMSLTVVVLAGWQAMRLAPHLPDRSEQARGSPRREGSWRRAARPLVIVTLFTALFADLDLVIVGLLLPPADLAIFGVCLKLAFLVGFGVQMVTQLVGPDMAEGYAQKDHDRVARAVLRSNALLGLATLAALAGAAVFGDEILGLFGPDFAAGYPALILLVGAQCVRALAGPSIPLLTLAGGQRRSMTAAALSLGVLVATSILLTPVLGFAGAALAVAVTMLFWAVSLAVALHRRTGLRTDVLASLDHWRRARRMDAAAAAADLPATAMAVRAPQVSR